MKRIVAFIALILTATTVFAQGAPLRVVEQKSVIIVDKTSRTVKCSEEEKPSAGAVAGGAALGAAAGGLAGRMVSKRRGGLIGALAGAGIGAMVTSSCSTKIYTYVVKDTVGTTFVLEQTENVMTGFNNYLLMILENGSARLIRTP